MLYRRFGKRLLDVIVSVTVLVGASPVLIALALLVRSRMGTPVLFVQKRPGVDGRVFSLIKFRTMQVAVDSGGGALTDSQRLTRLGLLLRQTSLDELPEFWNVLKGDMSLVGPRPLLVEYLPRYSATQARRHEVRPGITGWAQVNGRNALTWERKFELDVWYVDNMSLWLDLRILRRTLVSVLRREGISAAGETTVPPFAGST